MSKTTNILEEKRVGNQSMHSKDSFKDLGIPISINSSTHDLTKDFFVPLLKCAHSYDRGVGFFSSGWLKINAIGLNDFADNGGKARWITSPILSKKDWEALQIGEEAKQNELLKEMLKRDIQDLTTSLEKKTLSALAWMVADGLLEFKLAVTRGKLDGDFHDKFGIFTDNAGNKVSFNGSYNESIQGTRNYESFKVFKSWEPEQKEWVADDVKRFEQLWNNKDPNVRVLDIGTSNREKIIQLRNYDRPYKPPKSTMEEDTENSEKENTSNIQLRDYQKEAIKNWFDNSCKGFFEMATGTGKTFTALAAAKQLYERHDKLFVIIAAPYQHLVDQWEKEAEKFGITSLLAYKSKSLWIDNLNSAIVEFNNGYRDFFCVITTHTTFTKADFQESIKRLKANALVIADEAHHLGTETAQQAYPQNIAKRLALSATPNRWYDEEGTAALRNYFGKTVYEFPLKDAIGVSLTPYYYYPVIVELTPEELEIYEDYTLKIVQLLDKPKNRKNEERMKFLLLKRAEILNKASNKLSVLSELLDKKPVKRHTLFYCAPGQIDEVIKLVGKEKGITVHPFTAKEDMDYRQQLLSDFANGYLQSLAAIKCLDEGVDVPHTETAYLLASTSNPREFIQRRGRILRKAKGKKYSYLYDLITVPYSSGVDEKSSIFTVERNIMRRELRRFKEFAEHARNKHQAIDVIWTIAKRYHLMDF